MSQDNLDTVGAALLGGGSENDSKKGDAAGQGGSAGALEAGENSNDAVAVVQTVDGKILSKNDRFEVCCDSNLCYYTFWSIIGVFLAGATVVGFATGKPWFGVLALLSVLPAVVICWAIMKLPSRYSLRVTTARLMNIFVYGVVGAVPCAILELIFSYFYNESTGISGGSQSDQEAQMRSRSIGYIVAYTMFDAFIVAALCEESLKYYLIQYFPGHAKVVRTYDIVVLATVGALGFATLENVGYIFSNANKGAFMVAAMRAVLAVPLHAGTGMLMGLVIAKGVVGEYPTNYFKVLFFPWLVHGLYDFVLMFTAAVEEREDMDGIGVITVLSLILPVVVLVYSGYTIRNLPDKYFNAPPPRAQNEPLLP